jgi:hypothetical protein
MLILTLNLLTTTIVAPPSNVSKWQMGFNSALKGLKHLKMPQHVSFIIQIIIREFVGSLLKSLNLKFNCHQLNVVIWQRNVWCMCVAFRVVRYVGLNTVCSPTYLTTWNITYLYFNKEPTNSLMVIWMMIGTRWSVLSVLILTF